MGHCWNCGLPAGEQKKFQDPRRGKGEEIAYVTRFYCSQVCKEDIIDKMERQANYARLCN